MRFYAANRTARGLVLVLSLLTTAVAALAQAVTGSVHGTVTDPSGAAVTNATLLAVAPDGQAKRANTNRTGAYEITGLLPQTYTVTANAPGFASYVEDDVPITPGQSRLLNIALSIEVEKQKIDVVDQGAGVDTNPANNAGAIVMSGKDLDALPDDPDELQTDLEALAGPSAGPNGGQIYIDGFTGGQLPPKSSIREIRINQNPFSAEYDKLGYGRIEVFTKPGTDKFHGQVSVLGNSSAFNSQNPFLAESEPAYHSTQYMGNVGGPLGKKASFYLDAQRRNVDEVTVINATLLDPNADPSCMVASCLALPYSAAVPNPHTRTNLSPRLDYQVSKNNTLTARYQYFRNSEDNDGVGQFALEDQGYHSTSSEHTVQISDTQVVSSKVINETRIQYMRDSSQQVPLSTTATVSVLGAFTTGGSGGGTSTDSQDHYELQNYTSMALGNHFLKFGGRLRATHEVSTAAIGFNGTWLFQDLVTYKNAAPFQYSITQVPGEGGMIPTVEVQVVDAGLYVQDDWRWRPNITLSYGLRFETQNAIGDHGDWAPRLSFAWGIGGSQKSAPKTVLRAGFGMFYDRFSEANVLQAERLNGVTQLQYIASCTAQSCPVPFHYPTPPTPSELGASSPTTYQIDPRFRAPYIMQTAVSVERQLTKNANVTVSYLNSRGFDQLLTRNINAPLPPFTDPSNRPIPGSQANIYQYESEGVFRQNQMIVNGKLRAGARLMLFGYYTLNDVHSNTSGGFPSNQFNLDADYGRAAYAVRHRLFLGGSISVPFGLRFSPFMLASSGAPYNVTTGNDLNGDSITNDRPSFAANVSGICVELTAACHYNLNPGPNDTRIPINYLTGPTLFTLNLRVSKTFGFGRETGGGTLSQGGGPPAGPAGGHGHGGGGFGRGPGPGMATIFGPGTSNRRYNLTLSVNARNLLNRVNPASPIGNLSSPSFAQSIDLAKGPFSSAAANRKIELQATFSF